MITTRKTPEGYIWAYAIYYVVNKDGTGNLNGKYCFVDDCWLHPKHRSKEALSKIVQEEHILHPSVETIYYMQRKHKKRWKLHNIRRFYNGRNP